MIDLLCIWSNRSRAAAPDPSVNSQTGEESKMALLVGVLIYDSYQINPKM